MAERNPEIARTIIEQLGRGTLFMLGAKNLVDHGDGLSFRIRGSKAANYVEIKLDAGLDLYNVEIKKIGRAPSFKVKDVASHKGVYADMLHELIENATGLATRMPRVHFGR